MPKPPIPKMLGGFEQKYFLKNVVPRIWQFCVGRLPVCHNTMIQVWLEFKTDTFATFKQPVTQDCKTAMLPSFYFYSLWRFYVGSLPVPVTRQPAVIAAGELAIYWRL
jgi:hypothetical protein